MSTIYFDSTKNYLKRHSSSGNGAMSGPSTSAYGGYIYVTEKTITHGLGFPVWRVYYEPFGDGIIYTSFGSSRIDQQAQNPNDITQFGPNIISWLEKDELHIQLFFGDDSLASNSYPVYWVIYEDFSL